MFKRSFVLNSEPVGQNVHVSHGFCPSHILQLALNKLFLFF